MSFIRFIIVGLLCLFTVSGAMAQAGKKPPRDFNTIKTPGNIFVTPDDDVLIEDETGEHPDQHQYDLQNEEDDEGFDFDGGRETVMGMEDTSTINEGEVSIVEVDEELQMDCVWVKIAQYYSVWDSRSVNPYRVDGREINNIPITMYDSTKGRNWVMPLRKIFKTSDFGFRKIRWHYGVDLGLTTGDSIFAIFDGVVRMVSWDGRGWGNYVLVRHYNGLETLYGHQSKTYAKVGDFVKAGDLVGFGGSTGHSSGPHLHLEIRYAGNPIDPNFFFDFQELTLRFHHTILTPANFTYLKRHGGLITIL